MSIFNWRKKKDEDQKKQVMEPKKIAAMVHGVSESTTSKPLKETEITLVDEAQERTAPRVTGDAHRILMCSLITEKNTLHQTENQYVFEVARRANKIEVQKAVEATFKVKVIKVRIINMRGKVKQFGRMQGVRKFWKKAIVTVGKGDQITLLSSV